MSIKPTPFAGDFDLQTLAIVSQFEQGAHFGQFAFFEFGNQTYFSFSWDLSTPHIERPENPHLLRVFLSLSGTTREVCAFDLPAQPGER